MEVCAYIRLSLPGPAAAFPTVVSLQATKRDPCLELGFGVCVCFNLPH